MDCLRPPGNAVGPRRSRGPCIPERLCGDRRLRDGDRNPPTAALGLACRIRERGRIRTDRPTDRAHSVRGRRRWIRPLPRRHRWITRAPPDVLWVAVSAYGHGRGRGCRGWTTRYAMNLQFARSDREAEGTI